MAQAKARLITSDIVYKNLRFAVQLDEDSEFFGEVDMWMGYEDGKYGPMEQRLSDFVTIEEGGDLPFHSIWYFRSGGRVLWDRRRRLDELKGTGDTPSIHAVARGEKVKGFDVALDLKAGDATTEAIRRAAVTMAEMEEERLARLDELQRRNARKQAKRIREKEERERQALAARPKIDAAPVKIHSIVGTAAPANAHAGLRVVSWNAMNDAHAEDYPAQSRSVGRAAGLARVVCEQQPDIVALQEATPAMIAAIDTQWPGECWRTDAVGELGDLVVWSRNPIARAFAIKLGANTSKVCLLVEVIIQRRAIAVACVHLTSDFHGDNATKRAVQARIVRAALAERMPHAAAFICGDFNEPNADGKESAVLSLEGLTDSWLAAQGPDNPGCTFDPVRNELAAAGAHCMTPRRLDRIFAAPTWSVQQAILLGEGQLHSDHYGLLVSFVQESSLDAQPVHTSAVVIIPPESLWGQIDDIRKQFDKSYGRWMPHINLIYGFLPESYFSEAAAAMEAVLKKYGPMEVHLENLTLFEHANSASLVIVPRYSPDAVKSLQQELQALFPACVEQSRHEAGFQSHLTLGKFEGESWAEDARRWKDELAQTWRPMSFIASNVSMIARVGDQPFGVRCQLPLGSSISTSDNAILDALEAASGTRAFAIGSALLLGNRRDASSDLDVLLVGTRDRDVVFQTLESCMGALWTRRAMGKFPLLQMCVAGTKLDIQYARSNAMEHPLFWSSAICKDGCLAASALRDVHKLRALVLEAGGMDAWNLYQCSLLKLKRWAKSRGIDSNAFGYLGGFSWSLLLADTLLDMVGDFQARAAGEPIDKPEILLRATCRRFATWPWPKPLSLGQAGTDVTQAGDLMPVLCPTDPYANSARNITTSTLVVLQKETERRAIGETKKPHFEGCHSFVFCQVKASDLAEANCIAHWLEARLLVLVRKLDHLQARPLCVAPGLYAVGTSADAPALQQAANEFSNILIKDDQDGDGFSEHIEVEVCDRDAMKLHVQAARR